MTKEKRKKEINYLQRGRVEDIISLGGYSNSPIGRGG
jgi:hypothetical protein